MLVLAAVPAEQCHKLRRAAAPRFPVVHARDWDDALAIIRTRPVELAAVDPQLEGSPSAREIERLRVLFPSLPLILYTALTPATAAVLLALGHSGINAVVFTRIDDHPARLREVLAHEEARSASRQLLDQLAAVLAPLPSELRWVVDTGVLAPAPPLPRLPAPRPPPLRVVGAAGRPGRVRGRGLVRRGPRVLAPPRAEPASGLPPPAPADAVLLDVQLPTMSGLALYLALIHRHPALAGRIAIMSGDAEADNVRAWLQNNPCTVLKKPFDLRQIIEWARELLDMGDRRTGNG